MPLPITSDVGTVMRFLNKEKSSMPYKQKVAIALNQTGKSKKDYDHDVIRSAIMKTEGRSQ